jgi:hypothetical protein
MLSFDPASLPFEVEELELLDAVLVPWDELLPVLDPLLVCVPPPSTVVVVPCELDDEHALE